MAEVRLLQPRQVHAGAARPQSRHNRLMLRAVFGTVKVAFARSIPTARLFRWAKTCPVFARTTDLCPRRLPSAARTRSGSAVRSKAAACDYRAGLHLAGLGAGPQAFDLIVYPAIRRAAEPALDMPRKFVELLSAHKHPQSRWREGGEAERESRWGEGLGAERQIRCHGQFQIR